MRRKAVETKPKKLVIHQSHLSDEEDVEQWRDRTLRQTVKGNVELAAKLRRRAIYRAKRALKRNETPKLWIMLGDIYCHVPLKKMCCWNALRLDPTNSEAAYELAHEAFCEGRIREAERLIERAIAGIIADGIEDTVLVLAVEIFRTSGNKRSLQHAQRRLWYWKNMYKEYDELTLREVDPDWDKPDPLEMQHARASSRASPDSRKHPGRKR